MPATVRFAVDPRLATILGDAYRSTELAIKELVDNAWDADADEVRITLPAEMSTSPIIIEDDGSGMTEEELRSEYLTVARDRRSTKGNQTAAKKRRVRGRRGIGKFAGLMVAQQMEVCSTARGRKSTLLIDGVELTKARADFEAVEFPLTSEPFLIEEHGTTITLSGLKRRLSHPNADKLRKILALDFGRATDFVIYVNEQLTTFHDIPGEPYTHEEILPTLGAMKMSFVITDGKQPLKHPGIVIKVGGKAIGEPTFFGLDRMEDVPYQVLKRIYGEVEADGLQDDVTADWAAIIENSTAYQVLESRMQTLVREKLEDNFERDFNLLYARIQQQVEKRVAALPEHRREYTQRQLKKILKRFYGEEEFKIQAIVDVVLDALERDEYWAVLSVIHEAKHGDVQYLADALTNFGILELILINKQARSRLELLDSLDVLISDPRTLESQVHQVFDTNLWVLGSRYALVSSNRTMKKVVEEYTREKYKGESPTNRPDLLLLNKMDGQHILIEFKRPSKTINRDDDNQAQKYRDDLGPKITPIEIMVIGGEIDRSLRLTPGKDVSYFSYVDLLATARAEIEWLLTSLAAPVSTTQLHLP